jgi:hypothetical protein
MQNRYQGFQPKSFVSRRSGERDRFAQNEFQGHRVEDYMDDEDFGEFGIAPKKIRLAGGFSVSGGFSSKNIVRSSTESVGEKILRCIAEVCGGYRKLADIDDSWLSAPKNNYHGLGYQPLKPQTHHLFVDNPLEATLRHGQKLKISGEAFGVGVFEDDDDLHHLNEYGYDNISNYKFEERSKETSSSSKRQGQSQITNEKLEKLFEDSNDLNDFELAKDSSVMQIREVEQTKYPLPIIDDSWQQPERDEPYVPPKLNSGPKQDVSLYKDQSAKFSGKFTSSITKTVERDTLDDRTGLIQYSDLREFAAHSATGTNNPSESNTRSKVTTVRRTVEWRPCSLLCKHFNVPNPYPDNTFLGAKPSDLLISEEKPSAESESFHARPAPIELRRSIFNVDFDEPAEDVADDDESDEDRPQIVELNTNSPNLEQCMSTFHSQPNAQAENEKSDEESDIIILDAPKQEPEVIVLSSSSSSSSPSSSSSSRLRVAQGSEPRNSAPSDTEDDDAYGPPLPPSHRMLHVLGHKGTHDSSSSAHHRRSKHKKKSKSRSRSRHH